MTALQPFTFPATGQTVRTVTIDDEPWFVAADVAEVLGYYDGRKAIGTLPERMRNSVSLGNGTPGNPNRTVINEPGVYRLAMRSSLATAEAFQDWLAEDVVPSIRKTGSYEVPSQTLTELEVAQRYVAALQREQDLKATVAELAPGAHAWGTLATAADDYDVATAAKILSRDQAIRTGRTRLFTYLANQGWIYRTGGHWSPYQRHVDNGRLLVLPSSHYHPRTGELVLDPPQVRITVKGLGELHKLLGGGAQFPALMSEELAA